MSRRQRRRLVLAAGALLAAPARALAQPRPAPRRVGFLPDPNELVRGWFVAAMKDHGWSESRDYVIVQSGSPLGLAHVEPAARRVIAERPDVILAASTGRALAAQRLTTTIPIVMWTSGYPVEVGLADSLARPGRNVTGNTIFAGGEFWGRMVELLAETKPGIRRLGVLWGYAPPEFMREEIEPGQREIRQTARALGLTTHLVEYASPEGVAAALEELDRARPDALIIAGRRTLGAAEPQVMLFAMQKRLPTIVNLRWPLGSALHPLLAYGPSSYLLMRQAVTYVDQILKGAKPGDLPIQQPSKIEFVVNLKTAKIIGLMVPPAILGRADEVIE